MNTQRIATVINKEWQETLKNKTVVWTFVSMLLIFTLMPLALAFGLPSLLGEEISNDPDMGPMTALLEQAFPEFQSLNITQQFQVFMLRQFISFFLILPVAGAMSIATYSIIGEKTSRSLEALLATPIRTDELLIAKSVAAALPGAGATWIAFGLFAASTYTLGGPAVARFVIDSAALALIILIVPLVALFGLGLGVVVSSRVNDPRSAQQLGGLVVLPIVALMVGQSSGVFLLGLPFVLMGALVLLVLDIIVLGIGVSIFNREAILTRWR